MIMWNISCRKLIRETAQIPHSIASSRGSLGAEASSSNNNVRDPENPEFSWLRIFKTHLSFSP